MEQVAEKGPWVALPIQLRDHGGRKPIFDNGIWWILPEANQERCPIAIVDCGDDHDEPTRDRAKSHAYLIAAAPTMREYIAKRAAAGDSEASAILEAADASR